MSEEEDGSVDNSSEDSGQDSGGDLFASLSNFWNAGTKPENLARVADQTRTGLSATMDAAAGMLNGRPAPTPTPAATTPGATPPPTGATPPPAAQTPPPAGTPAAPEEKENWMVSLMFKFMPKGVKDWSATVAIPMVTQGQALIAKMKKPPKVEDGIGSYISCLQGNEITVIPKTVKDYAVKLLDMLGLGKNEELATALSVGFVSFVRTHLSRFIPGIKAFNDVANLPAPSPAQLLGFATNPQTFIGLFGMAPGNSKVEPALFSVFKTEFAKKHGIENIDKFFADANGQPLAEINYGQFIQSYAGLGRQMVADGKWSRTTQGLSDEDRTKLVESAGQLLEKYGVADTDGSLAEGLAVASMHGSEMISSLTKGPKPGTAPAPAAAARP